MIELGLDPGMALLGLGAIHGLNPGMGWLFAVALGLQEQRRAALWGALPPLVAGHAAAIAIAAAAAGLLGQAIPLTAVQWTVGVALVALGVFRLRRHRHPRGGMRVGPRDLAIWSLLMATAHGAGLMVLPVMLSATERSQDAVHAGHGGLALAGIAGASFPAWSATLLHGTGYLLATMLAAVLVYEKLGVGVLRRVWVNVDLIWAGALIGTGVLTVLV